MHNTDKHIYSITEITRLLKNTIEGSPYFNDVSITGEIYNITYHSSGHIYFSLKDNDSLISAVFFKNSNRFHKIKLENGMKVIARGSLTIFEKRGSYQINISAVQLDGQGELQKQIEQLKIRLHNEGIFDPQHKKKLPFLPIRIGVVTSPTGAAIQDILKVALQRYPNIEILLAPAKVQGDGAAETISAAIEELNRPCHRVDVIIAGRGGGSFEDLLPFNDERVIRAFYHSAVPIVSAVGHQIDHPLCDDAADVYAATPSHAAEIVVPEKSELTDEISYYMTRMQTALNSTILDYQRRLTAVSEKKVFTDPLSVVNSKMQALDYIQQKLLHSMKQLVSEKKYNLTKIHDITGLMKHYLVLKDNKYEKARQALHAYSPLNILSRGYSIPLDNKGIIMKKTNHFTLQKNFTLKISDGEIDCTANKIRSNTP